MSRVLFDLLVRYTVIGGDSSEKLARKIAKRLGADYIRTKLRTFPDGEIKVTLSAEPKKDSVIVLVQSTSPPVDSNLIQILSIMYKVRRPGAKIIAVIPYMGYARQDKEFLPGEIVTIRMIAKLFKSAGASRILVVDIHSKTALKQFGSAGRDVSAIPNLARHLKKLNLKKPLVVSPDAGGAKRARQFAELSGLDFIVLQKRRDRRTGKVKMVSANMDVVQNRDLIIIDDMISTGGSIIKAAEFLKKQRCRRIFVACTHALLINDARKKIRKAGVTRITSTNTVPGATSTVDISNTLATAIQNA